MPFCLTRLVPRPTFASNPTPVTKPKPVQNSAHAPRPTRLAPRPARVPKLAFFTKLAARTKLAFFSKLAPVSPKLALVAPALCLLLFPAASARAKRQRPPAGGRTAVVIDERLAAVRAAPDASAPLVQRLGRGRLVSVRGPAAVRDGVTFRRVAVTGRTSGWVQAEALAAPSAAGDDARLLRLIRGSTGFDRVERAALFLETFPRSPHRPAVLLLLGDAAEDAAARLSRDASSRLDAREVEAGGAPPHTYFLNYSGLDRFDRLGVRFLFDRAARRFHYDGAAWREILRRHPQSPEAAEARRRLEALKVAFG